MRGEYNLRVGDITSMEVITKVCGGYNVGGSCNPSVREKYPKCVKDINYV